MDTSRTAQEQANAPGNLDAMRLEVAESLEQIRRLAEAAGVGAEGIRRLNEMLAVIELELSSSGGASPP